MEVAVGAVRGRDAANVVGTSGAVTLTKRLSFGVVALARCQSKPTEGKFFFPAGVGVAIHEGAAIEMEWRSPESDRIRSSTVANGNAHLADGRLPFWIRFNAATSFFALSIQESFLGEIWQRDFRGSGDFAIAAAFGIDDPVIGRLCALAQHEFNAGGPAGRLYMEGLAAALAVHLLRRYPLSWGAPTRYKGGLSQWRMRRVIDYIDAHLADALGLVELAAIAGLSPHHFAAAFKASVGKAPHQFVIERRVRRALNLLGEEDLSIAEIARATGFSSPSHLTANFRRVTGATPGRFRQSLV
jgi:AraC family transcriptional regulator